MESQESSADLALSNLDISLFVASLAVSVIIGVYFANKNGSLEEYMLGGRDQRFLPVAVSMMTSYSSGISLIGGPAELYHHGPTYALMPIGMFLSVPISALILLPVFYRLGNVSIFTYLESRYCPAVKRIISFLFVIQMTIYNAVVLYVPSLSLKSILGISEEVSIGLVGAACLVYCTLGGIKAVIWTDFFQAAIMYLSLVYILIGGFLLQPGGPARVLEIDRLGGRLDLGNFLNFDLTTRHTLFTVIAGNTILSVFMHGANQIQVQRAMSLPSLRLGQLSQALCAVFSALISTLAASIGLLLYSNFAQCDPFSAGQIDKRDAILIYYVHTKLNQLPGIRGFFIAGIFAATLSTLSSFQNSMAALVLEDFIRPATRRPLSERFATNLSKLLALTFGLICIGLTFVVGRINGLLQAAITLFGALGSPLVSAYLLGVLTRFTNSAGMLAGMLAGYTFGLYVQFYQIFYLPDLQPTKPLSIAGCIGAKTANSTTTTTTSGPFNFDWTSAATLAPPGGLQAQHHQANLLEQFLHMSYLWLPLFAVTITVLVASLVSLLTGGWQQEVEDKFLVSALHRKKGRPNGSAGYDLDGGSLVGDLERQTSRRFCSTNKSSASHQLRSQVQALRQELKQNQH